jgi:hypothetical protein
VLRDFGIKIKFGLLSCQVSYFLLGFSVCVTVATFWSVSLISWNHWNASERRNAFVCAHSLINCKEWKKLLFRWWQNISNLFFARFYLLGNPLMVCLFVFIAFRSFRKHCAVHLPCNLNQNAHSVGTDFHIFILHYNSCNCMQVLVDLKTCNSWNT